MSGISPVDANDNSSVNDEEETAEMSQIVWEDRQGHKSTEGQSSSDDSEEGKDQNRYCIKPRSHLAEYFPDCL